MMEINALHDISEAILDQIPYPDCAVSKNQNGFRLKKPPPKCLGIQLVLKTVQSSARGNVAAFSDNRTA